jgi:ATP-dependent Clp protease protease subunit
MYKRTYPQLRQCFSYAYIVLTFNKASDLSVKACHLLFLMTREPGSMFGVEYTPALTFVKKAMKESMFNDVDPEKELVKDLGAGMQRVLNKNLLDQRMVFLWGAVEDSNARIIVEQLCYLSAAEPATPIHFYINSPGGMVTAGNAIHDIMKSIAAPVYTYCVGYAASMASILLSAGERGNRYIYPLAEVMIHQPSMGEFRARLWEIEIHARQIAKAKEQSARILAANCGQEIERIKEDFDKDYWMDAQEAIQYGIVDKLAGV